VTDTIEKTPLWQARESVGLSREHVTRLLDPPISAKTLERWEKGISPLRPWWRQRLAVIYDVDPEALG
jgi:DNA-binding transcriptional regulator YiaG